MRLAIFVLMLFASGCAGSNAVDSCEQMLAGTLIDGTYEVEPIGALPDSSRSTGHVFGWVAERWYGSLVHGAGVSVDSLAVGAVSDSVGSFGFALAPGSHRLTVRFAGFDPLMVPVEVRGGHAVEVRARLGTFVPGADVCVSGLVPSAR